MLETYQGLTLDRFQREAMEAIAANRDVIVGVKVRCGRVASGDQGWNALKMALVELDMAPHELIVVSGIGCGSKLPHYMNVNGFQGLHGRPLPVATGARLANHGIKVVTVHGDGDGYGRW